MLYPEVRQQGIGQLLPETNCSRLNTHTCATWLCLAYMLHANTALANSITCTPCEAAPDMGFIISALSQHIRAIEQASCCFSRDSYLDLLFQNLYHWTPVYGVTHLVCIAIMPQEQMLEVIM